MKAWVVGSLVAVFSSGAVYAGMSYKLGLGATTFSLAAKVKEVTPNYFGPQVLAGLQFSLGKTVFVELGGEYARAAYQAQSVLYRDASIADAYLNMGLFVLDGFIAAFLAAGRYSLLQIHDEATEWDEKAPLSGAGLRLGYQLPVGKKKFLESVLSYTSYQALGGGETRHLDQFSFMITYVFVFAESFGEMRTGSLFNNFLD